MDVTPAVVLEMWTAGLAAGAALVTRWRVVGAGYTWLAASVIVLFGLPGAAAGGDVLAWAGLALAAGAAVAVRTRAAGVLFAAAAVAFLVSGLDDSPVVALVTGAVLLGGITSEMMLGHWYLVDPRLPRWALKSLVAVGGAGLIADVGYLAVRGVFSWAEAGAAMGWSFVALAAATGLLVVGVWYALEEPRYSGVMAATGLSYLATLTAIGSAVVGRMVAFGG